MWINVDFQKSNTLIMIISYKAMGLYTRESPDPYLYGSLWPLWPFVFSEFHSQVEFTHSFSGFNSSYKLFISNTDEKHCSKGLDHSERLLWGHSH